MSTPAAESICRQCRADLEHCHGTVVHHASMRAECTEPDCVTPEVVHAFDIDCDAIGCTCAPGIPVSGSAHRVG
ncbi:hypothetical protein [Mycolicibacterium sp. XJ1819]